MKKTIALLPTFFLFTGFAFANDLTDAGLLGKVKAVDKRTFDMVQSSGQWYQATEFDSKEVYAYDTKGNVIEEASAAGLGITKAYAYVYDAKGNKTGTAIYGSFGSLSNKEVYTYDAKGHVIEKAIYNPDGSLFNKDVYAYDAKGNKTEDAFYNGKGSLVLKEVYAYDAKGYVIEKAIYNPDGSLGIKWVSEYDAKGNKTEDSGYRADGSLSSKWVYAKGNVIKKANYNVDGSLYSKDIYVYEYDTQGNWTKKTSSKEVTKFGKTSLEPTEVTIRTITYYP